MQDYFLQQIRILVFFRNVPEFIDKPPQVADFRPSLRVQILEFPHGPRARVDVLSEAYVLTTSKTNGKKL